MANSILFLVLGILFGLVLGTVLAWFVLKIKIQAAVDKTRTELEAERATLNATLQARDDKIQGLNTALEKTNGENARLQNELI